MLDRTRHLPRDFVQLLKCIQQAAGNHKRRLTEDIVASGFRNYSRSYFLAEIRDELAGHFSVEQRDVGLSAIAKLRAPRFTSDQFAEQVGNAERDAHRFITSLYDCGALGTAESGIYTYKYRNPHMPFNADADISFIARSRRLLTLHRQWPAHDPLPVSHISYLIQGRPDEKPPDPNAGRHPGYDWAMQVQLLLRHGALTTSSRSRDRTLAQPREVGHVSSRRTTSSVSSLRP